jgi:phage terminase small subunit
MEVTEKTKKMTAKEERFCFEYFIDYNATRAAKTAGYSEKTAYSIGQRLLKKAEVKERIQEMQDHISETAGISILKIIKEHEKIAFSNVGNMHDGWMKLKDFAALTDDQKAAVQIVSTKQTRRIDPNGNKGEILDEMVRIKLYDKQKSLDSLSKLFGFEAPIKAELTGKSIMSGTCIEIGFKNENEENEP